MIAEERNGHAERQVLIAAITSTTFLNRVSGRLGKQPFRSVDANTVWTEVSKYHAKYGKAPDREIESLISTSMALSADKDLIARLDRLLSSLSEEYGRAQKINVDFLLDMAEQHFNTVLLERHREELIQHLERGHGEAALQSVAKFVPVNLHVPPSTNILDLAAHQQAFTERQNVLVRYPGPAGEFFGDELAEDSFVAFMAPAKGAKSFLLLDIAWRAMRQGHKVAYFQIGDLSWGQILRRFQKRALYRPFAVGSWNLPVGIVAPTGMQEIAQIEQEEKIYEQEATWADAERALQRVRKKTKGDIQLFCHATKSVSVLDIKNTLAAQDQSAEPASVVVIDYAGNLAPVDRHHDPVEQVSHTWAIMRQISEVRKCLVVTAQQSNKEGFRTWVLTRNNFAESKMILAHVTAFLGINRTEEERRFDITRLNFVVARDRPFVESDCLYCASAFAVANPIVVAALRR